MSTSFWPPMVCMWSTHYDWPTTNISYSSLTGSREVSVFKVVIWRGIVVCRPTSGTRLMIVDICLRRYDEHVPMVQWLERYATNLQTGGSKTVFAGFRPSLGHVPDVTTSETEQSKWNQLYRMTTSWLNDINNKSKNNNNNINNNVELI